jgi:hypothetical protein
MWSYLSGMAGEALAQSLVAPLLIGMIFSRRLGVALMLGAISGIAAPMTWRVVSADWAMTEDDVVRLCLGALIGAGCGMVGNALYRTTAVHQPPG